MIKTEIGSIIGYPIGIERGNFETSERGIINLCESSRNSIFFSKCEWAWNSTERNRHEKDVPLFPPSFREEKKKKKIRPSQEDGLFLPVTRGPRVSYVSINLFVQRRRR